MLFGKGKMEIQVSKVNYHPGDTISGYVTLSMKKLVKGREVAISLVGEQTVTRPGNADEGNTTETTRIYEFKLKLDGEKEYDSEYNYKFEIIIPPDILARQQMPEIGGAFGQGLKIVQSLSRMNVRTNWYLHAKLDIPGGIDVGKKLQITIT
jgi:hypothetical protein